MIFWTPNYTALKRIKTSSIRVLQFYKFKVEENTSDSFTLKFFGEITSNRGKKIFFF